MNQQLETLRSIAQIHTLLNEALVPGSRHRQLTQSIAWLEQFHKEIAQAIIANPPPDITEADLTLLKETYHEP